MKVKDIILTLSRRGHGVGRRGYVRPQDTRTTYNISCKVNGLLLLFLAVFSYLCSRNEQVAYICKQITKGDMKLMKSLTTFVLLMSVTPETAPQCISFINTLKFSRNEITEATAAALTAGYLH